MTNITKQCSRCQVVKPLLDYYSNPSCKDGYMTYCKVCLNKSRKVFRHPPDPSISKKTCRRCRKNKPVSEFSKHDRKKDGYSIYCKVCVNTHFHGGTLSQRFIQWKGQAKFRQIPFSLSFEDIQNLPRICHYTGVPLTLEKNQYNTISLDRLDSGKGYFPSNVVLCCEFVNRMKGEFSPEQLKTACRMILEYAETGTPAKVSVFSI